MIQFEWAWQHPDKSRRLKNKIGQKRYKETPLKYRFRILSEMLLVGPWRRLPLTIRWLNQEYELDFPLDRQPPVHMPIAYGQVELMKEKKRCQKGKQTAEGASSEELGEEEEEEEAEEGCEKAEGGSSQSALHTCYICHQCVCVCVCVCVFVW